MFSTFFARASKSRLAQFEPTPSAADCTLSGPPPPPLPGVSKKQMVLGVASTSTSTLYAPMACGLVGGSEIRDKKRQTVTDTR